MEIGATWTTPGFTGVIGVARRDVTPPFGIFAKNWGPTVDPVSTGAHRAMTLTSLALSAPGVPPLLITTIDLCTWRSHEDEWRVRGAVLEALSLPAENVLLHLTHTHSSPGVSMDLVDEPGGHLIPGYLDALAGAAVDAAREAIGSAQPATLRLATGRCSLAVNRDLPHHDRYVVGFNPEIEADDTVLVGRVTSRTDGSMIATIVNYACHPTTLAWKNQKISPDYVGSVRQLLEERYGVPCLFLQGASGDLAPRRGYSGDTGLADANGRILGYAATAAIESMLPEDKQLVFEEVVESGAPLAMWELGAGGYPEALETRLVEVPLGVKQFPSLDELRARWRNVDEVSLAERLRRAQVKHDYYTAFAEEGVRYPVWIALAGEAVIVAVPGEAYSFFQRRLREAFPQQAVLVMNLTNCPNSVYLPTRDKYTEDVYAVWQTVLEMGALESVTEAAIREVKALLAGAGAA